MNHSIITLRKISFGKMVVSLGIANSLTTFRSNEVRDTLNKLKGDVGKDEEQA